MSELQITLTLSVSPRWWFRPALWGAMILLWLGWISDAESADHWGGRITAEERASKWLANYAFRFGVVS